MISICGENVYNLSSRHEILYMRENIIWLDLAMKNLINISKDKPDYIQSRIFLIYLAKNNCIKFSKDEPDYIQRKITVLNLVDKNLIIFSAFLHQKIYSLPEG